MDKPRLLLFTVVLFLLPGAMAAQLRQIAIIDIPGRPGFDTLAWANGQLVIAHTGADTVDVFDPVKRRLVAQVPDIPSPRGIAVDASSGRVYVASAGGNRIVVLDAKTWKVAQSLPLEVSPHALLLLPDGNRLYTANRRNGSVSLIRTDQAQVRATIAVGGIPQQMAYDSDRQLVLVTVQDRAEVVAIDSNNAIAKRFKLAGSQPTGIAIDTQRRRLYVAVRYAVVVLDADSGAEVARVPTSAGTDVLWFDASNRTLFAGAGNGSVNMIRIEDGRYTSEHEFNSEVRGHSLAFDPTRKMVYLPGGREGRSKLVILRRVENPGAPANARGSLPAQSGATTTPQAAGSKR